MKKLTWSEFEQVDIRCGLIEEVLDFPEAHKPAYKIKVFFGEEIGIKWSSAQITQLYQKEDLVGMKILGVINFPPKQIGPFMSECLITGFETEQGVVLAVPDQDLKPGLKLS